MAESEAPRCCDKAMIPILYGMPGPEMLEEAERGEIKIGGCIIEGDAPTFRCTSCGRTTGRLDDGWDDVTEH